MRLLPNQVAADIRRSLDRTRVGHLHPTDALEALPLSNLTSIRFSLVVPGERPLQLIGMLPEGKPGLMPIDHLEVELAEPGVVGQTSLLRWCLASALSSKEILAQNNTPLQFLSSWVLTMTKVDSCAIVPELTPRKFASGSSLCERRQFVRLFVFREQDSHSERLTRLSWSQQKEVRLLGSRKDSLALPRYMNKVNSLVNRTLEQGRRLSSRDNLSRVSISVLPVAGVVAVSASRVRETERQRSGAVACHFGRDQVSVWVAYSLDEKLLVGITETALNLADPHIELALDLREVRQTSVSKS